MTAENECDHQKAQFGCASCVRRVRATYPEFPIIVNRDRAVKPGPLSVPWAVAEKAWAAYAQYYGTGQSVERLAQRGGFYWGEMDIFFPEWREAVDEWRRLREELATERNRREEAEKKHERLLRRLEQPLGPDVSAPVFTCRTGETPLSGAPEYVAQVTLTGFNLEVKASTAGEATALALAQLAWAATGLLSWTAAALDVPSPSYSSREDYKNAIREHANARAEAEARAEQAECERDAAREVVGLAAEDRDSAIQRARRAEAGNAALLKAARALRDPNDDNSPAIVAAIRIIEADHPGTALLEEHNRRGALLEAVARACRGLGPVTPEVESVVGRALKRLQALEKVREACEPYKARAEVAKERRLLLDDEAAFLDACAAADALKEKAP